MLQLSHKLVISVCEQEIITDGIYRYLSPLDLLHVLKEAESIVQFANVVMKMALEKGGKDNLSIIIGLFSEGRARL